MIQTQREDPSMEAMFEDAIATCSAEKDQLEVRCSRPLSAYGHASKS